MIEQVVPISVYHTFQNKIYRPCIIFNFCSM